MEHLIANRYDPGALRGALSGRRFDVVLDVIPFTERQARELVEVTQGIAHRLVAISSADVYRNYDGLRGFGDAPPDPAPLTEDAPLRETLYPYRGADIPFKYKADYDKILVERVVKTAPQPAGTIIRVPAVYGPGDRQHRLRPYVQRMNAQRPFILLDEGQARWSWTRGYVDNVAAAVALAVTDERAAHRTYNTGDAQAHPESEWVKLVAQAFGWKGDIVPVPEDLLPDHLVEAQDWAYHIALDTSCIRRELDYDEPVSWEEALRHTVEWEISTLESADPPDYAAEDEAYKNHRECRSD